MTVNTFSFADFNLKPEVIKSIKELNFTLPTPVQEKAIPVLINKQDVIGQAATGTGKTAAFGLPLLQLIDADLREPQALILVPTRELAIQVSKAIADFARYLRGFSISTIYGGGSYRDQIRELRNGAQIIVGTPGRIMDHMRRESIDFSTIEKVVLDEADEMLRMGFIDDVEWILAQLPARNHTALFSATMPKPIRKIAMQYLNEPVEISIVSSEKQESNITQQFLITPNKNKLKLLNRILEVVTTHGVIIFARTKAQTEDIADFLIKNNYMACALNGDMPQTLRKKTIDKMKNGDINILVATDVAARGLDIDKISHVINYDSPHDLETYVHRIGRTGRAGRTGTAILFLTPNEQRMLRDIEQKTRKPITELVLPTNKEINELKIKAFKETVTAQVHRLSTLDKQTQKSADLFATMIAELQQDLGFTSENIGTAIALLHNKIANILLQSEPKDESQEKSKDKSKYQERSRDYNDRGSRPSFDRVNGRRKEFGRDRNSGRGEGRRNDSYGDRDRNNSDRHQAWKSEPRRDNHSDSRNSDSPRGDFSRSDSQRGDSRRDGRFSSRNNDSSRSDSTRGKSHFRNSDSSRPRNDCRGNSRNDGGRKGSTSFSKRAQD